MYRQDHGNNAKKIELMNEFNFNTDFSNLPISTKTIICLSNWNINIKMLYELLPVIDFTIQKKKRKRKNPEEKTAVDSIDYGSIVALKYEGKLRGNDIKQKGSPYCFVKRTTSIKKYFPNSLTIVMMVDKLINFKISNRGKFQFTGCKLNIHAEQCIKVLYSCIQKIYSTLTNEEALNFFSLKTNLESKVLSPIELNPFVIFKTVMTNKDLKLDFTINRQKLDQYINEKTEYYSITETSQNYTGINIKIASNIPKNFDLKCMYVNDENIWNTKDVTYTDYLSLQTLKERKREVSKVKYHTFLLFYSGSVICSTPFIDEMKTIYPVFINNIVKNKDEFEEKLD